MKKYKTVAQWFEKAQEPLRSILLDNFNNKYHSSETKVCRLRQGLAMVWNLENVSP